MFKKVEFSNKLKECQGTLSLNEFAKLARVDAGYLSRIINGKKDNPPNPDILRKIANASNGITTYKELMILCGYIEITENENERKIHEILKILNGSNLNNIAEIFLKINKIIENKENLALKIGDEIFDIEEKLKNAERHTNFEGGL